MMKLFRGQVCMCQGSWSQQHVALIAVSWLVSALYELGAFGLSASAVPRAAPSFTTTVMAVLASACRGVAQVKSVNWHFSFKTSYC